MKLLSAIEKWDEVKKAHFGIRSNAFDAYDRYINLLKQPIKLGQFVPCNSFDEIMTEPDLNQLEDDGVGEAYEGLMLDYKEAKERVIFKGFEVDSIEQEAIYLKGPIEINFTSRDVTIEGEGCSTFKTLSDLTQFNLEMR